jgi:hypothetical protein
MKREDFSTGSARFGAPGCSDAIGGLWLPDFFKTIKPVSFD